MNMHGFISIGPDTLEARQPLPRRLLGWLRSHKPFLVIVILPTVLTTLYFYLLAANQYETQAKFVIQSASGSSSPMGFGDILGFSAPVSPTQSQAMGVSDYLESQQVADYLRHKLDLVQIYRRPGADVASELHPAHPTPERLLHYYLKMTRTQYDRDTGISTLDVRTFRPADSYAIISTLLQLSEQRVNLLNERAYNDAVKVAEAQVAAATENARQIEISMTSYRQTHQDIDPTSSGLAQTTLLIKMQGDLAAARSQLALMGSMISRSSPQYRAMQMRVSALETEVNRQEGTLTGGSSTIAAKLGGYEDLKVRQEFAGKRYDSAAAALEKAREQAQRQSLYLLRIVEPVMPVKSLYPERGKIVLTVFLTLLIAYGIGWLIVAGVREHAV